LLKSMCLPVMIVRGVKVVEIPRQCGKAFSQNTLEFVISMTIRGWGHNSIRESIVGTSSTLLDSPEIAFNFTHVFVAAGFVKSNANVSKITFERRKLVIHKRVFDDKPTATVYLRDGLDGINEGCSVLIGDSFHSPEMEVSGDGHNEGDFVDKH
jgi:hypothetical protein